MEIIILLTVLLLGFVVGSFLNVVIFRLESGDKIVNSRSKCLKCGHKLSGKDLFPILSFLSLKGRCRYCRDKISWQYPLVELITGIVFVAVFLHNFDLGSVYLYNFSLIDVVLVDFLRLFFLAFIFSALIVIFVYDLRHYIIPDEVIFSSIFVAFLLLLLESFFSVGMGPNYYLLAENILSALLAGGFFLFLVVITKGKGMGGGDVKLGFLMGLVLGFFDVLLALFISFVLGSIVGTFLVLKGDKGMKSMVPFGPFLVIGFLLSYFYSSEIIDWYWNSFLIF